MSGGGASNREGQLLAGKYRLVKLLGSGGMGAVYRARNEAAGRDVAIKVLHPEMAADEEAVGRFLQEARAANKVRHVNVVQVLDVDREPNGAPYIVQELLEGDDFARVLEELRGRLGPEGALQLLVPIVEAIGVGHLNGVVHRDLKPSNVFLANEAGRVVPKVLDFGIARVVGEKDRRITATGIAMGTPAYMAPEVIQRGSRAADPRSDVWSLGVMLYEILGGELPFEAETMSGLFVKICTEDPKPLEDVAPHVPASLVAVVRRCLQRDAAARYPDAAALAKDLRAIQSGEAPTPQQQKQITGIEKILAAATLALSSRPPPPAGKIAGVREVVPPAAAVPREMTNLVAGPRPKVDRDAPTKVAPIAKPDAPMAASVVVPTKRAPERPNEPVAKPFPETRAADLAIAPSPSPQSERGPALELRIDGLASEVPAAKPAKPAMLPGVRGPLRSAGRAGADDAPAPAPLRREAEPVLDLASVRPPRPRISRGGVVVGAGPGMGTLREEDTMRAGEIAEVLALLAAVALAAFAASLSGGLAGVATNALGDRAALGLGVGAVVAGLFGLGLLGRGTIPFLRIGELIAGAGLLGYAALLTVVALQMGGRGLDPGLPDTIARWALVGVSGGVAVEGFRRAWSSYRSDETRVRVIWFGLTGVVGAIIAAHALIRALTL